ncbi:MAG: putative toxin-antitoxin system toxin component, PIN family [Candidatus Doudnabacteria bacterium RIFCSPLOWO2_02_FULL_49_13]|uniref:Putative toxin-antitoxin system toxin component, PIN family n=1 Tax=Candidatus Doudnabacteria bacterium RIFCSPHIGHO2_12_FULL_48_16 TaxID=1817838 RepID=A0A1F5PM32_9BACT|nr:MAG: putative toxin-antitoxin system toxin component, PIN family [Candidatus Doudnabacteria bacterium RIFCSPHIGHO2_02_FULL_49_24]OGE88757.1 MAG: putative toxin-antitoxin system toxin component, PIN family [Candidatus Doudnabacteria bacterium RIFCSPHIGHO2_01_FULL_50_67]OGE90722.1 MAG: putative toxin-antitoxin system toxin component, PIN family [Candidatus Doudnabacteria bacterium RIFCSPHIGHO2_12_FULL_48_16]OGE97789.1 MAG: putative toxin-antitoxin system toxin component, PIN family [Candidatus 
MLKVVIDTNVLIDASEDYYRYANRILDLVIANQIMAYANRATLNENKFLARRKISDEGYLKKLEYFFEVVQPVATGEKLRIVEDPEDDKILESAVASGADYLITSDLHLLKLEKYHGVRIVRPAEFWSIWEDEGEGWVNWLSNFIK